MLFTLSTDKTMSETAADLNAAAQAHHFGVLHVHNLKESMKRKSVSLSPECQIFEVCQPQELKKALDGNMSISTALPSRISVYEKGGRTILATLKPTAIAAMFDLPQLLAAAQDLEAAIIDIMKEAATPRVSSTALRLTVKPI
jgi:uncharacterized protein (DUF302 family)